MSVTIYKAAGGKQLELFLAELDPVQNALDKAANRAARKAKALLATHRAEGDSFIEVESGDVDRYVVLNDTRGQKAAMSIEYGREPNPDTGKGGMAGLMILHRAVR